MPVEEKEDGFENILNDNLVLDGGDEDMLPVESFTANTLSESPAGLAKSVLASGSPTIMSSLLSRRVVHSNTNFSALNLLNDENGASPMLGSSVPTQSKANSSHSHGSGRNGEIYSIFRRCSSMIDQRLSPPIKKPDINSFNSSDDFTSPISRSNSGVQSSGFKRPFAFRRPASFSTDSCYQESCQPEDQDICIDECSVAAPSSHCNQELNLRNDGHSKRRRWDVSKSRPPLLKSQSMSAIGEESSTNDESSNEVSLLCRGQKNSGRVGARLYRSKSTIDPAANAQIIDNYMEACSLAEFDPNRTGDTRRSLPITQGHTKNQDLKNIDGHTMANVLNGELDDKVAR
jgi:hypothetical protein